MFLGASRAQGSDNYFDPSLLDPPLGRMDLPSALAPPTLAFEGWIVALLKLRNSYEALIQIS